MDMYVRMMDDLKRAPDDNPTVGIILCTQKDASVVRYSVLQGNEQIFASRYRLVLPSEDELRAELERERNQLHDRFVLNASLVKSSSKKSRSGEGERIALDHEFRHASRVEFRKHLLDRNFWSDGSELRD